MGLFWTNNNKDYVLIDCEDCLLNKLSQDTKLRASLT